MSGGFSNNPFGQPNNPFGEAPNPYAPPPGGGQQLGLLDRTQALGKVKLPAIF